MYFKFCEESGEDFTDQLPEQALCSALGWDVTVRLSHLSAGATGMRLGENFSTFNGKNARRSSSSKGTENGGSAEENASVGGGGTGRS